MVRGKFSSWYEWREQVKIIRHGILNSCTQVSELIVYFPSRELPVAQNPLGLSQLRKVDYALSLLLSSVVGTGSQITRRTRQRQSTVSSWSRCMRHTRLFSFKLEG